MVGIVLTASGFTPEYCPDGDQALDTFLSFAPDLVLLDVMLPGQDGITVCREIRKISGTPIIMLTAKTETQDVVLGLEAGADDYIVKPFEPSVLTARINARLRPIVATQEAVTIGPLTLDVSGHQVLKNGTQISLTPLEFNLLLTLAQKPKQVFTREMLLEKVWGYHYKADTRLVNVHVQRLRSKIEEDPDNPTIVTTVRGIGYRAG
jgi:two-component system response regulator MtrA